MNKLLMTLLGIPIGIAALQIHDAQAASQYKGIYELTLTVTVATPLASGQSLYCLFTVSDRGDPNGSNKGYGTGVATMNAGGTQGTCTVKIPYDWTLANAASNSVTPSYAVAIAPKASTTAMALALAALRLSDLPTITGVPASGTTALSAISRL